MEELNDKSRPIPLISVLQNLQQSNRSYETSVDFSFVSIRRQLGEDRLLKSIGRIMPKSSRSLLSIGCVTVFKRRIVCLEVSSVLCHWMEGLNAWQASNKISRPVHYLLYQAGLTRFIQPGELAYTLGRLAWPPLWSHMQASYTWISLQHQSIMNELKNHNGKNVND